MAPPAAAARCTPATGYSSKLRTAGRRTAPKGSASLRLTEARGSPSSLRAATLSTFSARSRLQQFRCVSVCRDSRHRRAASAPPPTHRALASRERERIQGIDTEHGGLLQVYQSMCPLDLLKCKLTVKETH